MQYIRRCKRTESIMTPGISMWLPIATLPQTIPYTDTYSPCGCVEEPDDCTRKILMQSLGNTAQRRVYGRIIYMVVRGVTVVGREQP